MEKLQKWLIVAGWRIQPNRKRYILDLSRIEFHINSFISSVALSESIAAPMIISNADDDRAQSISSLAAAKPNSKKLSAKTPTNECVTSVRYETITSIVSQCEKSPARLTI